jgi:hypothetical protein
MSKLSPIVFAQHARQFLDSASREQENAKMGMSLPAYFLVGRAIELALKSYMLLQGQTEKNLRAVGHNLAAGLDTSVTLGLSSLLTITPESDQAVRWINDYYESKDLEYPTTGYKSYPEIRHLFEFADSMLTALMPRLRSWRPNP